MIRRALPLFRCASQIRTVSAVCSKLPQMFAPPLNIRTKMESKQGPTATTGHLDKHPAGISRETPTSSAITAELFEVLCNFKDYKIDKDSVSVQLVAENCYWYAIIQSYDISVKHNCNLVQGPRTNNQLLPHRYMKTILELLN